MTCPNAKPSNSVVRMKYELTNNTCGYSNLDLSVNTQPDEGTNVTETFFGQ